MFQRTGLIANFDLKKYVPEETVKIEGRFNVYIFFGA